MTDQKTGQKVEKKSTKYWGRYRDENGTVRRRPLATDKIAAQSLLNELVRKVELKIAGLHDPFEQHRKRPLAEHLFEFGTNEEERKRREQTTVLA